MTVWLGQNEKIHKNYWIKDLEGRKECIKTTEEEYEVGLSRLPAYGFSFLFQKKEKDPIQESSNNLCT